MTSENNPPSSPSFGDRLSIAFLAFVRALIRLMVIVLLAALLGFGFFWGIPALYRQYVLPIQTSVNHLEDVQYSQDQTNQLYSQRLDDLLSRLDALEVQSDTDKQTFTGIQTHLENTESTQQARVEALDSAQATASAQAEAVNIALETADAKLTSLASRIEQHDKNMQALATQVQTLATQVQALEIKIQDGDAPATALRHELQLVKTMELLTRSRLFLAENNIGLVQQDIQAARDLLVTLLNQVPAYQLEALAAIVIRLGLALENLPAAPVLATDDLEIAWQLLLRGLPEEPSQAPNTTEVSLSPNLTGTPTPFAQETPSPSPTASMPTITPTP